MIYIVVYVDDECFQYQITKSCTFLKTLSIAKKANIYYSTKFNQICRRTVLTFDADYLISKVMSMKIKGKARFPWPTHLLGFQPNCVKLTTSFKGIVHNIQ